MKSKTIMNLNALHRGIPLAASVVSSSVLRDAWIGIYPLDLSRSSARKFLETAGYLSQELERAYHIRYFETLKNISNSDASIGEDALLNKLSKFAFSDDDLVEVLKIMNL